MVDHYARPLEKMLSLVTLVVSIKVKILPSHLLARKTDTGVLHILPRMSHNVARI